MTTRTTTVSIGDLDVIATYSVHGRHCFATMETPEEWPEIELEQLTVPGADISGLLEFASIYEHVSEQIDEQERETNYGRDPDPDESYDRWRDEQLESA